MTEQEIYKIAYKAAEDCMLDSDIKSIEIQLAGDISPEYKKALEDSLAELKSMRETRNQI